MILIDTPDLLVEAEVAPGSLTLYQTVKRPWVAVEERRIRHQLFIPPSKLSELGVYLLHHA